jgi:hypothetical protein
VTIPARQLNRATLARQGLLRRQPVDVAETVRGLVALQAQEPASPYLALWNRIEGFDAGDLDAALADGTLLKSTLVRITLHLVHAEDHPILPPGDAADAARGPARRSALHRHGAHRRPTPMRCCPTSSRSPRSPGPTPRWRVARRRVGEEAGARLWWALRTYGPFRHAVSGDPWRFGRRPTYLARGPRQRTGTRTTTCRRWCVATSPPSDRRPSRTSPSSRSCSGPG